MILLLRLALAALLASFLLSAPALATSPEEEAAGDAFEAIEEPPAGAPLSDPDQIQAETHRISLLLRCPVCQGLSVADSREGLSLAMRERVRELVAAGYTEEQILDYFVLRYGESIVLRPDARHRLVWLGPGAAVLGGLLWIGVRQTRRRTPQPPPPPPGGSEGGGGGASDDEYRRRVLAALEEGDAG